LPRDPRLETKLDEWVAAYRRKDYVLSNSIQAELRKDGVEPQL